MSAKTKTKPVDPVQKRLNEIAAAVKAGASPAKFERELDRLLGTGLDERDEAQEEAWEQEYRRSALD